MMHINEDVRRDWLRALRRFKQGIKLRAKLGVIQTICEQVAAERIGMRIWESPYWEHDRWVTLLCVCIKANEYPPELLTAFVRTAEVTLPAQEGQPTVDKVLDAVDQVCRQQSKRLRCKFGVFEK